MISIKSNEEYKAGFQVAIQGTSRNRQGLEEYLSKQFIQFERLLNDFKNKSFWEVFPEILGIDAKLVIFTELIKVEEISTKQIIQIVEHDYRSYFKEVSGYSLNMKPRHSLVYNVK